MNPVYDHGNYCIINYHHQLRFVGNPLGNLKKCPPLTLYLPQLHNLSFRKSMPPEFRLTSFVLLVNDVEKSKAFYRDLLKQEILMDIGINVGFAGGLALWQRDYAINVIHGPGVQPRKGNDVEVYFETPDISEAWETVRSLDIPVIHELREQPWCQRVFRIYDPDQFVVEIAEPMEAVVRRLNKDGLSEEEIVKRSFMPAAMVRRILG